MNYVGENEKYFEELDEYFKDKFDLDLMLRLGLAIEKSEE